MLNSLYACCHKLLESLINNLLTNSIRYNIKNGNISVTTESGIFMVSNSGDNSILNDDIIFKRFTRSFDSNQGNGLGLAIVSQICKYHNWKIDYEYIEKRHSFKVDFN